MHSDVDIKAIVISSFVKGVFFREAFSSSNSFVFFASLNDLEVTYYHGAHEYHGAL